MVKQILQFPMLDLIFIKICFGVRLIISSRRFVFLLTTQTYCLSCFISIKCLSVNLLVWAVFCTSVWGKCADSIFSSWNLLNWKCCKSNTFHSHTSILNLYFTKFEGLYWTPINRTLKMQFNVVSGSWPWTIILELWKIESVVLFFRKSKYKYKKILNNFLSQSKIYSLQKVQEKIVLITFHK